jgi:hypothetical protein
MRALLLLLFALPVPARAGIYLSQEDLAALPSQWKGFLVDQKHLRLIAKPGTPETPATLAREQYQQACDSLKNKTDKSADEVADYVARLIRLGNAVEAVPIARQACREHPKHFRLHSHLASALQLSNDLSQAAEVLEEAVRLAPRELQAGEKLHLKLVRNRLQNASANLDALFDLGKLKSDATALAEAIAGVQKLALWFPLDGLLIWQLAELAALAGDQLTPATLLEGAVGEFGLGVGNIRARRIEFKQASDKVLELPEEQHRLHRGTLKFASTRPLLRRVDPARLPAVAIKGPTVLPWAVLADTLVMPPFTLKHLDFLEKLDGKEVQLIGFLRSDRPENQLRSFQLVEYPIGCWFCDIPDASGIIDVSLREDATVERSRTAITIIGTLKLNRDDPEDFLFRIAEARVKSVD